MPCVVNDYGATCVASKNPEFILFTKDAMCFGRMPHDYKSLVYNLKASTPTKTCLISA